MLVTSSVPKLLVNAGYFVCPETPPAETPPETPPKLLEMLQQVCCLFISSAAFWLMVNVVSGSFESNDPVHQICFGFCQIAIQDVVELTSIEVQIIHLRVIAHPDHIPSQTEREARLEINSVSLPGEVCYEKATPPNLRDDLIIDSLIMRHLVNPDRPVAGF